MSSAGTEETCDRRNVRQDGLQMTRAGRDVVFQGKRKFKRNGFSAKSRIFIYVGVAQWIVQSPPKRKIGRSSRLTNVKEHGNVNFCALIVYTSKNVLAENKIQKNMNKIRKYITEILIYF